MVVSTTPSLKSAPGKAVFSVTCGSTPTVATLPIRVILELNPVGVAPGATGVCTTPEITPSRAIVNPGGKAPDTSRIILVP